MASAGDDDEADAVLSDVEAEDDPAPPVFASPPFPPVDEKAVPADRYREVLAELERERSARQAAEAAKSDLQAAFNRLKVLAHEAIKKRDEAGREKEEALKSNEKLSGELTEAVRAREEAAKQRDEALRQVEEAGKLRDASRAEIESAAQLLVRGIEKVSGKIANYRTFTGGLPRSQQFNGLPAIAYGVIKRSNEIVDELLKQLDMATKSGTEAREQMEQRNYEIAIEVSQLEATISSLRDDLAKKTADAENLEKTAAEKDETLSKMEKVVSEKLIMAEKDVQEFSDKVKSLELKLDLQKPLIVDHLSSVSKTHDQLCGIIKLLDPNKLDQVGLTESIFLANEVDMEENLKTSLAGMTSIYELGKIIMDKVMDELEERGREVKGLNKTVEQLVKEKKHIGSLLRSALSGNMALDGKAKTSELLQIAENGLREAGLDVRFNDLLENGQKSGSMELREDEVYTLAGALEKIVKASQVEIVELQHHVEALRAEISLHKAHMEAQVKEISQKKQYIKELEEKERAANESVEGLMMDIAAAEEEISRWKLAAEQEAAAGKAVQEEFAAQLSAMKQELEEAKQVMLESQNKLKFKEETADAAMAARDAAVNSLRLADMRATRLRERVEELSRLLEEMDNREDSVSQNRPRYVCWPWQWLGLNFVGNQTALEHSSNEMELSEPLL